MSITAAELIEILSDLPEGEDTEIRIAEQPNWPFEYAIANTVIVPNLFPMPAREWLTEEMGYWDGLNGLSKDEAEAAKMMYQEYLDDFESSASVVYLVEERQLGYLPLNVKSKLGW